MFLTSKPGPAAIKSQFSHYSILIALSVLMLFTACSTSRSTISTLESIDIYYEIDGSLSNDEEIARLIAPYVTEMQTRMNQVIAYTETDMHRGQPEGTLGNMSADILRFRAVRELGRQVEIAVVNNGGLRVPISKGNITVGNIYELMPFENTITVLTLSGAQVQKLADQIAEYGGQPVSGLRFRIHDGKARDILVNYEPLNLDRTYLVATNNYMADGGETLSVLWEPIDRIDLPVLIREAMIEYIRMKRNLDYELEQRIRVTEVN